MIRHRVGTAALLLCALGAQTQTQSNPSTYTLPSHLAQWMAVPADIDGDGQQEIVTTTMDPGQVNQLTAPTQIMILGVEGSRITDRTAALFGGQPPLSYSSRPAVGDFDGDGQLDLMICDRGRNFGPQPPYGTSGTVGVWRAQNQVFLQRNGVLVDHTAVYPQTIACSWGCSAGDVDRSGRASIVVNAFGPVPGFPSGYLVKWDGAKFSKTLDLRPERQLQDKGFTVAADFNRDGVGDAVWGDRILWGGGTALANLKSIPRSQVEADGYTFGRGAIAADFTGDGRPDLVKISSRAEPSLAGARFALFTSNGAMELAEKVDAFPALSTYRDSDFGNDTNVLDVNFDGALDIVAFGAVYAFDGSTPGPGNQRPPTAVWLNDGTGRFTLRQWSDRVQAGQTCAFYEAYFLKSADSSAYNLVVGGCGKRYAGRTVTPADPITFTP